MQRDDSLLRRIKIQRKYIKQERYKYIRSELRLCGKWLEEYGFDHGKVVTIRCEKNQLTVYVEPYNE